MKSYNNILFIQYGDYKAAFLNFRSNKGETYYAQKHSVDYVSTLKENHDRVIVLCLSNQYKMSILDNGVEVIGVRNKVRNIIDFIKNERISKIVLRTPIIRVISYAIRNDIAILPIFADSFDKNQGIIANIKWHYMAGKLNSNFIKIIGNHSTNACFSLSEIGVRANKIVPWDWPHSFVPEMFPVKYKSADIPTLYYAGQISREKGVFDIVDAIEIINKSKSVILKIAGNDNDNKLQKYISQKGLYSQVILLGLIPHSNVVKEMASADVVIVPSRHEYPEGLPMTIYEGLASRTPIIVSDHPMFANKIIDRVSGLIFEAGVPRSLADKCLTLISDSSLYHQISQNSFQAWHALKIKVEWTELVNHFIHDNLSAIEIEGLSLISYKEQDV